MTRPSTHKIKEETMGKTMPAKLRQKVAQSIVGTGPSLVPPPRTPKPLGKPVAPDVDELIPSIDQFIAEPEDRATLRQLVAKHLEINSQKKALEKQVDILTDRIKAIVTPYGMGTVGLTAAVCDGAKINYFPQERKTINETKLIAAGVEQDTIDLCTDVNKYFTLKVSLASA